MSKNKKPPYPSFRFGSHSVDIKSSNERGTLLVSDIRDKIKKFPLVELGDNNRFDFYDFKKINPSSNHFVYGFDDQIWPKKLMENHIPVPLKKFLQELFDCILEDLNYHISQSELDENDKEYIMDELKTNRDTIIGHPNTMLAMFSDTEFVWCPFNCLKLGCQRTEEDYLSKRYFTGQTRLNMAKHLELELCKREICDERYNFHFFYTLFIACLPNNRGMEIRSIECIMNKIEDFVPEEEVFEYIENIRMKIRKKVINKAKKKGTKVAAQLKPINQLTMNIENYKKTKSNIGGSKNPIEIDD